MTDAEIRIVEHVCGGTLCNGSYICDVCEREVGWCIGADDEMDRCYPNGICDPCWAADQDRLKGKA